MAFHLTLSHSTVATSNGYFKKKSSLSHSRFSFFAASRALKMRDNNLEIPNEFTALKSSVQKDVIAERLGEQKRKSQWIQVGSSCFFFLSLVFSYVIINAN